MTIDRSAAPAVPALWPSWLSPRRIALGGAVLLFVDMILYPRLTPAGLALGAASLQGLMELDTLRGLAYFVVPAVSLGLLCAAAAMHGRSAVRAALGCLGAGAVFGALTAGGGYMMLMSTMPLHSRGGPGLDVMLGGGLFPGQELAFTLSLLGLALTVARSHRVPSCDAVQEALVVTGAWLLAAGMLVRWNALGLTLSAHLVLLSPGGWSLPCVTVGLALLVTGIAADHRLLAWLGAVRRGEQAGWRIEALGARDVEVLSLTGARSPDEPLGAGPDGLLVLDRDAAPVPVAWVFLEGSDRRRLVMARLRAVALAVGLLLAVWPVLLAGMWFGMQR